MRTFMLTFSLSCLLALYGAEAAPATGSGVSFSLTDQDGRTVTERNFAGRYMLVFFGYTHCPDICPTTLQELSVLSDALPSDLSRRLSMVFVTGDPQRDTPAVMKEYLSLFGSKIIGLSGSVRDVDDLAWALKAVVIRQGDGTGYYPVDHSTNYILLHDGQIIDQIPNTLTTSEMVERLGQLVK